MREKGIAFIEENKDCIIEFCCKLVQTPSENPPGDVRKVASVVDDLLEEYGIKGIRYEPERGRVSVVAKVGKGRGGVILDGHMDVVPAGDRGRWKFDPFCGLLRGGQVLGRGADDMKGGLTSLIWAFIAAVSLGIDLPKPLTLAAVPDEETGGMLGSKWLLDHGKIGGDVCLIGEPTGTNTCGVGEKGVCQFKLVAYGKPAHGSLPMLGENAILKLTRSFDVLQRLREKRVRIPKEVRYAVDQSKKVLRADTRGVPEATDALDHITINVGTIKGGTKINVVPDGCEAEIDVRVPAGTTPTEVIKEVEALLKKEKLDIKCEPLLMSEPNYTSMKEEVFGTLSRNVRSIVGVEPVPQFFAGATDARFFRLKGIPAIQYGPGSIAKAHVYNEKVAVKDIVVACKVHFATIVDLLLG